MVVTGQPKIRLVMLRLFNRQQMIGIPYMSNPVVPLMVNVKLMPFGSTRNLMALVLMLMTVCLALLVMLQLMLMVTIRIRIVVPVVLVMFLPVNGDGHLRAFQSVYRYLLAG